MRACLCGPLVGERDERGDDERGGGVRQRERRHEAQQQLHGQRERRRVEVARAVALAHPYGCDEPLDEHAERRRARTLGARRRR